MSRRKDRNSANSSLDIRSVIAAFSEDQVVRLTGLTKGRLRYWAQTDFFKPSFVEDDARLAFSRFYSFKDVVALRTLEMLRVQNNIPLQHLRKVASKLSHLKNDLWTKTTLYVVNKEVAFENPETGKPEAIVSGQYLLGIPLKKVIEDTTTEIIGISQRRRDSVGRIARSRNIARNAWVVAGTRIPIEAIKRLHEDGYSNQQIIAEYPDLTDNDISAALRHPGGKAA